MAVDDYWAWQGRREESRQEGRRRAAGEELPAPLPRTAGGISLDFEKRAESTTIVKLFRLALFKNRMGE